MVSVHSSQETGEDILHLRLGLEDKFFLLYNLRGGFVFPE